MSVARQPSYVYSPSAFIRPAVMVEVAVFTLIDDGLGIIVVRGDVGDAWQLPGAVISDQSSLERAALEVSTTVSGYPIDRIAQIHTFARLDDPSDRSISVAYAAVAPPHGLRPPDGASVLRLIVEPDLGRVRPQTTDATHHEVALAFDHPEVVRLAIAHLRDRIESAAFEFLPAEFTLLDVQQVHEAVLGDRINKDSFRRRALTSGMLEATGRREDNVDHRPAELFRLRSG